MRIGTGHGNYLAQVSGGNCTGNALSDLAGQPGCITKDVSRAVTWNIAASTILDQVTAKGLSWKSYNESKPSNCDNWLPTLRSAAGGRTELSGGRHRIFLTWDKGCALKKMPFIVIAPSVPTGRKSAVPTNQIGVLWNTQELVGPPQALGCTNAGPACPPGSTNDFTISLNL